MGALPLALVLVPALVPGSALAYPRAYFFQLALGCQPGVPLVLVFLRELRAGWRKVLAYLLVWARLWELALACILPLVCYKTALRLLLARRCWMVLAYNSPTPRLHLRKQTQKGRITQQGQIPKTTTVYRAVSFSESAPRNSGKSCRLAFLSHTSSSASSFPSLSLH
nr:MAG TPA: hypothetical protein [Caudoviricetes sp.]